MAGQDHTARQRWTSQPQASRRRLLRGLALGGLGLALGHAGAAQAFTVRSGSDYGAMLDGACGASADHRRQIAELESALGGTAADPRILAVIRQTACPSCGCPLLLAPTTAPTPF